MTRDRTLTDAELEDALRRFFDAERLPEIAMIPLVLLAEIARRVKEQKEAASTTGP